MPIGSARRARRADAMATTAQRKTLRATNSPCKSSPTARDARIQGSAETPLRAERDHLARFRGGLPSVDFSARTARAGEDDATRRAAFRRDRPN